MNKNRILRRERWTSGLVTAKSGSIKSAERRSGGCVPKAIELTSGDLCGCLGNGTEGLGREPDRRTEVSRGRSSGVGLSSGTLVRKERNSPCSMATVTTVKARTVPP